MLPRDWQLLGKVRKRVRGRVRKVMHAGRMEVQQGLRTRLL